MQEYGYPDAQATIRWGFNCDLLKAEEGHDHGERIRYVSGLASVESVDQMGETVVHSGINFEPLLDAGYINYDHLDVPQRGGLGPDALIGVPLGAKIVQVDDRGNLIKSGGLAALHVEGRLFTDAKKKPMADAAWRHLMALQDMKSLGRGKERRMGWSVQGRTLMKVGGRIMKSIITDLALTHKPVHLGTTVGFTEILKSFDIAGRLPADMLFGGPLDSLDLLRSADSASLAPLFKESMHDADGSKVSRAGDLMKGIYGEPGKCHCGHIDRATGSFKSHGGAVAHLHHCMGMDKDEAEGFASVMRSAWK